MTPAPRIMIVEDEVVVGMDLKQKVESLDYEVAPPVVRYGERVVEAARTAKPDLILMDIRLKGDMDGTEAARAVREELGLPVVFLSAYSSRSILANAKKANPHAYLKKPVNREELRISLELALYKAKMENRLRESELRYRTVADYTHDCETWIRPDGGYEYVSPSCRRVTGYPAEALKTDPDFFYTIIHPDDRQRVRADFADHLASRDQYGFSEFRILNARGETRWIEHVCQPVFSPDGTYMGRRASNRDVTLRKSLASQLEVKVEKLQEALDSIRTLNGMLPICSKCKKIRDDEGYWNRIESYIQNHSDARFTHSLCPACTEILYGDEDWYTQPE